MIPARRLSTVPLAICLVTATFLGVLGAGVLMPAPNTSHAAPLQTATPTFIPGTGALKGYVWDDLDGNGYRDPGEPPLAGMLVTAQREQVVATAASTADGSYQLIGLLPGVYNVVATPPPGYQMTTIDRLSVLMTAGAALSIDFGARFAPTPTPTPTVPPTLNIQGAERAYCGGVYAGDTRTGQANVSRYGCRPAWDESGPEIVYRVELDARQPISVSLLSASVDIDLFLLRYAYPESCVAGGDSYLAYTAEPGVYFLAIDGYLGAAGAFTLRVDCPFGAQASPTPTFTPSPTPTATPTYTPAPTYTPSPTGPPRHFYLPLMLRSD